MFSNNKLTVKLFRDASWLFGGKIFSGICSSLQIIALARILGSTDYGLIILTISFVDILNNFFNWKVEETATKYIGTFWSAGDKEKTAAMIKFSYLLNLASGAAAFLVAIMLSSLAVEYLVKSPGTQHFIWIYALTMFVSTSSVTSDAILRVFGKFEVIAYITSVNQLFRLIIICTVLFLSKGIEWVLICYVATAWISLRLYFVTKTLIERGLGDWWRSKLSRLKSYWREIAWFLANTSLAGTLNMGNDHHMAPLVLGFFSGVEAAAFYRVARSITKVISRIIDPINEAIYPELVKSSFKGALGDFLSLVKQSTRNLTLILIPITATFIVFAEHVITLVFGPDYVLATNTLKILACAVLIDQLSFWTNPALLSLGRPGLRTYVAVVSTLVYLLLLLILVPDQKYIGAAYAFLGYAVFRVAVSLTSLRAAYRHRKKSLELE